MRLRYRAVVTAAVAALALTGGTLLGDANPAGAQSVATGSDGTTATYHVQTVGLPSLVPRIRKRWYGYELLFNKAQTQVIAGGVGGYLGAVVGNVLGAAIGIGAATNYASAAVDEGNCLKITHYGPIGVPATDLPGTWQC